MKKQTLKLGTVKNNLKLNVIFMSSHKATELGKSLNSDIRITVPFILI